MLIAVHKSYLKLLIIFASIFFIFSDAVLADISQFGTSEEFSTKILLEKIYTTNIEEDTKSVKKLGEIPANYEEVIFQLIRRIRYEIQYDNSKLTQVRSELILYTVDSLLSLTNGYDLDVKYSHEYKGPNEHLLKELDYTIHDFNKSFGSDRAIAEYMFLGLYQVRTAILELEKPLPSLVQKLSKLSSIDYKNHNLFISSIPKLKNRDAESIKQFDLPPLVFHSMYRKVDIDTYKKEVERVNQALKNRVIEQPEVIDYLTDVMKRDYLHKREQPEVFMTLGLPGGGKDTIAENFIKALYKNEANWEDHIYRFSIVRSESDLWTELGSSTGYVGSEKFPPFLKWCVEHSGGKYKIVATKNAQGQEVFKVEKNPVWKGENLPGFMPPERAILFLNEFHDWGKAVKNSFAKQLLEKGVIPINNPNGGINQMRLNFNIQIASNDGIGLLADRHIDGRPRGKRQSYEELMNRWEAVRDNDSILRAEIMKSQMSDSGGKDAKGTSEEVANRIRNIFLLRPLSPEGLQKISKIFLENLKERYAKLNSELGSIKLAWTDKVVEFIQNYSYVAEENARPIHHKVSELIQKTIDKAIFDGAIEPTKDKEKYVRLDVIEKEDGTFELESKVKGESVDTTLNLPIDNTQKTKYKAPLSKSQVEELMNLPQKMKSQIFGVDHVIDKLSEAILKSEVHRNVNLERVEAKLPPANVFGFFGLSSTGKTETTKVLAEVLTGNRENIWTISGNQLTSPQAWEESFGYDQENPDLKSKFQKEFDRKNGRLIVVLDEISNSYLEGVKILYDYFREGEVGGRKMSNVTFILTGNAGQEWYHGIPSHVPEAERHFSMLDIYNQAVKNVREQEVMLMKYFPEALLKRIGMDRIFFFPPLNFKSIREMFMLKIAQSFKHFFSPNKETHWFDVKFKNPQEALRSIEQFEKQGFRLDGQGASIDQYVNDKLSWPLKHLLIKNHIPSGAEVKLSFDKVTSKEGEFADKNMNSISLNVEIPEVEKTLNLVIEGKSVAKASPEVDVAKAFTAYHEAGHSLVREVFLGDKYKSTGISIIPGVTNFGSQWIYYLGIARSQEIENLTYTKEAVLREMAVLHGGWMAQALVAKNEDHDNGKRNDMERATILAQDAILKYGLSERFGKVSIPQTMSIAEYVATMTADRREVYESELHNWMKESEDLARDALLINYKALIELGFKLAKMGDMNANHMKEYYDSARDYMTLEWKNHSKFVEHAGFIRSGKYIRDEKGFVKYWPNLSFFEKLKYKYQHSTKALHKTNIEKREKEIYSKRDSELRHESLLPNNIANIESLIEKHIQESREKVKLPENFPMDKEVESAITNFFSQPSPKMVQCKALFQ